MMKVTVLFQARSRRGEMKLIRESASNLVAAESKARRYAARYGWTEVEKVSHRTECRSLHIPAPQYELHQ